MSDWSNCKRLDIETFYGVCDIYGLLEDIDVIENCKYYEKEEEEEE